MKSPRKYLSALAGVTLIGGLLTPIVVAAPAQAATFTRSDVNCTSGTVQTGTPVSGSPADVVSISTNLTGCQKLSVSKGLVDDTSAITAIGGTISWADNGFDWVATTSALQFTSVAITLGSTPASDIRNAVSLNDTGFSHGTEWKVTISGSPNPPTPPTPTPATPPSAPTEASATAGNREATISWDAPASPGSFPVTFYQVQSTPSSGGCLVPVTSTNCRVTGLQNGVSYTFRIRARNGGGWGSWADTTAVTPGPNPEPTSIMIVGSRPNNDWKVRVSGETTGLIGATVQSMIRFESNVEFTSGSTRVVDPDGDFMWQRRLSPERSLEIYFTGGTTTSNTITIG
jgi:hypothetical protein